MRKLQGTSMTKLEQIVNSLRLGKRGGLIYYGDELIYLIQKDQIDLVILASDTPEKAKRKLLNIFTKKHFEMFTREELGNIFSVNPLNAIGIKSKNLASKIIDLKEEKSNGQKNQ